jgi:hypothetical protein
VGKFVDILKKEYADVRPAEDDDGIDIDAVLGLDVQTKQAIKTKDALSAVALDQAGFDVLPGQVVAIYADKLSGKHLYRFLRDIAYPDSCNADGVERCRDGTLLVHNGKIEASKWGSSDWWNEAYQRGLPVVMIVEEADRAGSGNLDRAISGLSA